MTAKYGLPETVQFCTRCVMSNQRPCSAVEYLHTADTPKQTIHFDEEGVCDACRVAEKKQSIDWMERERELWELCNSYRNDSGYDCLIPGSGGKDSFYAAHILKTKFKMHPLTVTWAPHMYTEWGRRNWDRWVEAGFSNILVTPDPMTHRRLTRAAVETLFHPFQPFIIGQKTLAPKIARLYGIQLVFYGENEAEYGNPKDTADKPTRSDAFHSAHENMHLSGVPVSEWRKVLSGADLEPYMPRGFGTVDVQYLGYYLKWHPQSNYYYAAEHGGFEAAPERTPGTYSKYNSIDDKIDDFHYWTTFQKFGIGRATYDASQEIRSGDITRDEGVALVHKFDGEYPERFEREINQYLSVPGYPEMTRERWFMLADKFRSPHLWDGDTLRHRV